MKKVTTIAAAVCVLCLAGAGLASTNVLAGEQQAGAGVRTMSLAKSDQTAQPDTLVVSRRNPLQQPSVPPLERTVTDAAAVRALYAQLGKLHPPSPHAKYNCPLDNGVYYDLQFKRQQTLVAHVHVRATGCGAVNIVDGQGKVIKGFAFDETTGQFRKLLAKTLGLTGLR